MLSDAAHTLAHRLPVFWIAHSTARWVKFPSHIYQTTNNSITKNAEAKQYRSNFDPDFHGMADAS
jgi:hypothetical protein